MEKKSNPLSKITAWIVLIYLLSTTANAQQSTTIGPVDGNSAWIIKPRIAATETLTDNASLNNGGGRKSDLISEIAPGLRIETHTARLNAYFDYTLRSLFYAQQSGSNQTQNSLNTFSTLEAVEKWLFIDFSGMIAQQSISAFGTQSPSYSTINSNSTETATYRISPYIRGQMGGVIEYYMRYSLSTTTSKASSVSDTDISEWAGQLRGSTPFQLLRWTIDSRKNNVDYSQGRNTEAESVRGMLTYTLDPQFRISLSAGQDTNNYSSIDKKNYNTFGYGFDWSPTERTQLTAFKEKKFFGDGHNIRFTHRFPMSSISFSDTRDVAVLPPQFSYVGVGSVYDLYFQQASWIPDPVARANYVNALLARNGISPNAQVVSGFLESQATDQRSQNLAFALFGARNTVTFLANRTESQSLLATTSGRGDLSQNNSLRQQGLSISFSHRLSDLTSLNAVASRQETTGNGSTSRNQKATMTSYQLSLATKLGFRTTGSLSARRSEFDSTTNPYTETALVGTVSFVY